MDSDINHYYVFEKRLNEKWPFYVTTMPDERSAKIRVEELKKKPKNEDAFFTLNTLPENFWR